MKLDWRNSLLQIFFNEFSFGATRGPEMLVKYANFVKIHPIAPQVAQAHHESPEQQDRKSVV